MEENKDEIKEPQQPAEQAADGVNENNEAVKKIEEEADEELRITNRTIELLRTVFDPEIPVNVYGSALIY